MIIPPILADVLEVARSPISLVVADGFALGSSANSRFPLW
jgi:hypothetical protein